jgi:hypothetical protein
VLGTQQIVGNLDCNQWTLTSGATVTSMGGAISGGGRYMTAVVSNQKLTRLTLIATSDLGYVMGVLFFSPLAVLSALDAGGRTPALPMGLNPRASTAHIRGYAEMLRGNLAEAEKQPVNRGVVGSSPT